MTKSAKIAHASKPAPYVVSGRTADGVSVLRSAVKPTHFTSKQIAKTIETIRVGAKTR